MGVPPEFAHGRETPMYVYQNLWGPIEIANLNSEIPEMPVQSQIGSVQNGSPRSWTITIPHNKIICYWGLSYKPDIGDIIISPKLMAEYNPL